MSRVIEIPAEDVRPGDVILAAVRPRGPVEEATVSAVDTASAGELLLELADSPYVLMREPREDVEVVRYD